ncbi:MAG: hypothetical protein HQ523_10210, partial [Lentisphaerae bacterium]|nr:hypothetical protein [Lentisphaerota bacterium]
MKRRVLIIAGSVILLFIANCTRAATITWTNSAGGNWSDAVNWDPNLVPDTGDDAIITAAGSYTINLHQSVSINSLVFGGGGSSPLLRVEGEGFYQAYLTLASSFTNNAVVELVNTTANRSATLTVNGGPLVNSVTGTLLVSAGAGGGTRTLTAELDNRGTLTVQYPLSMSKTGSSHTNSGSIVASADIGLTLYSSTFDNSGSTTFSGGAGLNITGNGSGSIFTTTGTLALGAGLMDVNNCTFNYDGTVTGSGTQDYSGVNLNLTPDLSNVGTEILLYNSTVSGPGTLINAAGESMLLTDITCNADLENSGDLVCRRTVNLNGGFENLG